ncbi:MAG: hypothetical protein WCC06_07995 [Candidatus Aminicenantales bacterium]
MTDYYFVRDGRHKYRFFSSEPPKLVQMKFSRSKKIWELAKKKLLLLPQKILRQEQAFERALKIEEKTIRIYHGGHLEEKRIKHKFYFFLQRQRTKHIFLLVGETLFLPVSGLAALLPGPNVFFGALALLMLTHWKTLRGINRILRKKPEFAVSARFAEWENAVESKNENAFTEILGHIEKEHRLENIHKVLWK